MSAMLVGAKGQALDHPTFTHVPAPAFVHHTLQLSAKRGEIHDALLYLGDVTPRYFINLRARLVWLRAQCQKFADRINLESQIASVPDKL